MAADCKSCGSPDGCEDCGRCWNCGPPCVEDQAEIIRTLAAGSATTWDVMHQLGESRLSMDQARSRLRTLEASGLVAHKMSIGPPGFCTFEWFLTDAGPAQYDQLAAKETGGIG